MLRHPGIVGLAGTPSVPIPGLSAARRAINDLRLGNGRRLQGASASFNRGGVVPVVLFRGCGTAP